MNKNCPQRTSSTMTRRLKSLTSFPPLFSDSFFSASRITTNESPEFSFLGDYNQEIRKLSPFSFRLETIQDINSHKLDKTQLRFKTEGGEGEQCDTNDWTLWSVWCTKLYKALRKKNGVRMKIEHEAFLTNVRSISNECPDFPPHLASKECFFLQLCGPGIYSADGNGMKKFRIEATLINFPYIGVTVKIICVNDLADIFADVLGKQDILIIFGSVLECDNKAADFNHLDHKVPTWTLNLKGTKRHPVCIIRVNKMDEEEPPSHGNILVESIKPSVNKDFYFFKYVAVKKGISYKIGRYRQIRSDAIDSKTSSSALETFLFPLSKEIRSDIAFDVLIFYAWKRDPHWPEFKQRNRKVKKQVSFSSHSVQFYYDPSSKLLKNSKPHSCSPMKTITVNTKQTKAQKMEENHHIRSYKWVSVTLILLVFIMFGVANFTLQF